VELMVGRSGYELVEIDEAVADTITDAASGRIGYEELVDWFRGRLVRRGDR